MKKIIILLLLLCLKGQAAEFLCPSAVKTVLLNSLIDKPRPLRSLKFSSNLDKAVSVGFYSSSFQEYLKATDSFEASDRLIGCISHALAKADPIILEPFHYPCLKGWQNICIALGYRENNPVQFVKLLDESRQKLVESLKGKRISSQRVEFYIPPLMDVLLLHTLISYPAFVDDSAQSLGIFQRIAESQKAYDTPLKLVDSLIEASSINKTEFEKIALNPIKDQWLTAYKKQLSIVPLKGERKDELGDMLSQLTIRFVTQGEDISPYTSLLFDKALKTPLFTFGALEKVVDFCELHDLSIQEQTSFFVLENLKRLDINGFHGSFQRRPRRDSFSNCPTPFELTKSVLKMRILGISNSSNLEPHIHAINEVLSHPVIKLENLEFLCTFCHYFNLILKKPTKKVILAQLRTQAVDSQQTVKSIAQFWPLLAYTDWEKYEFLDILLELNQEHFNRFFEEGINFWFDQLGIKKFVQPYVYQSCETTDYSKVSSESFSSQTEELAKGNALTAHISVQEDQQLEEERPSLVDTIYNCFQDLIATWVASYII